VNPSRQRWAARLALFAFAALCLSWLLRLDYAQKISTNVLDLIPPERGAPELGVVRDLADSAQARVMLFVLRDSMAPEQPPLAAASRFAAALAQSPLFAEAVPLADSGAAATLGRAIFDQRFALLLPSWLGRKEREFAAAGLPPEKFSGWLADQSAGDLEAFLNRPEAMALQELIPQDPLLLVPRLLERAQAIGSPAAQAGGQALVWARIAASPLTAAGQGPVFAAIEKARAGLRAQYPTIELRWTGVNRFAAASRARIEAEIKLLNSLSLLAVLAVSCLFVRRLWKLLHLVPVIACSLLGAWTVSTLVFPRLHVLVFVIGSLLTGVAVDYGFYIYLQPRLRPGETYGGKLRRLLQPLLASCLTTVIGFSLLLGSDLPLIRQVGVFVSAGLLCALGAAMLYFAQLRQPFLEARSWAAFARRPRASPAGSSRPLRGAKNRPRWLALAAAAIALLGPWRLHWRDDVRELDIPAPELHANDQAVRDDFGDSTDKSVYLTYGATLPEARRNLEAFLDARARTDPTVAAASLGLIFPTEEDWRALPARLRQLAGFEGALRAALQAHGFTLDAFAPFFRAWAEVEAHPPAGDYAALYPLVGKSLAGPLAQLYSPSGPTPWFLTIVEQPNGAEPPPGLHTVSLSQLQSLNALFTHYRWSALRLSLIGLALIIASVFAIYPFRRGLRIALIPAGSCFFVFGVLGLCGQTLNLFHLLGAFLGVCLAHNYSIFSSESAALGAAPPVPVRLSALCAAASFGVLSFSHIPVVHALGLTVALIVLTALAAVELEPRMRGRPSDPAVRP
jgi:predicted exporter